MYWKMFVNELFDGVLPITAKGYAHLIPQRPNSKRFDSGPQIFRKSVEFHPNGNATQPTIMQIAEIKKN